MAEALKCDVCGAYYDSYTDQFIYDKDGLFIKVIIKNFIFEDQSENNFLGKDLCLKCQKEAVIGVFTKL